MKMRNFKYVAITLGILAQPISSFALVVVNPVDKNPTAIKGSRATYGPDVVNHPAHVVSEDGQEATNIRNDNSETSDTTRTVIHTTDSSASMPRQNAETTDTTLLNTSFDQQAQMESRPSFGWLWALVALVVAGSVYYVSQRKDLYAGSKNGRR